MRRRYFITLSFLAFVGALLTGVWISRSTEPPRCEVMLNELRTMNIGEALGEKAYKFDPLQFASFTITNTGGKRVLLGGGETQVKEGERWQPVFLFKSRLNGTTLEPHQSAEFKLQTPWDDKRLWRFHIRYYAEVSPFERFKQRTRDVRRQRSLTNFFRPVWGGNFVVTKIYKTEDTNIIEQPNAK
jgi:hypothetical protein